MRSVGDAFPREQDFLYAGKKPEVGQYVKLGISFKEPRPDGVTPSESIDWCLMGGRVQTVVDRKTVIAAVSVTTLYFPEELEGEWDAVLVHRRGYRFPWVLKSLSRRGQRIPTWPTKARRRIAPK